MAERPWAEQADEIMMLLKKYHPIFDGLTWQDDSREWLVLSTRVFGINSRGQWSASAKAQAKTPIYKGWDYLCSERKREEIAALALQLLSHIVAVDCLTPWRDGADALKKWLPDSLAVTQEEIGIVQEEVNAK